MLAANSLDGTVRSRAELTAAAPYARSQPIIANRTPAVFSPASGCRLTWLREAPPVSFRPTPEAVYLVTTAAFPVGDDELSIRVLVEDGAALVVRSTASTVAWASTGSSLEVDATVQPGGSLDWQLQPLIASKKCRFSQHSRINLSEDASLRWADEVVLGRSAEEPGWLHLGLDITVDGAPLLRHQLELGPGPRPGTARPYSGLTVPWG